MDEEKRQLLTRIQDWICLGVLFTSLLAIVKSGNIDERLAFIPSVTVPECYKLISWIIFSMIFLRQIYGPRYIMAIFFFYTLSETIGNTYYLLFHLNPMLGYAIHGSPFDSLYLVKLLAFPALCFFFLETFKIEINLHNSKRFFIFASPFILFIGIWSLQGYHVAYDVCCVGPPYKMPSASSSILIYEAIFNFTYLSFIFALLPDNQPKEIAPLLKIQKLIETA